MFAYDTSNNKFVVYRGCLGGEGYVQVRDVSNVEDWYWAKIEQLRRPTEDEVNELKVELL